MAPDTATTRDEAVTRAGRADSQRGDTVHLALPSNRLFTPFTTVGPWRTLCLGEDDLPQEQDQ